MHIGDAFHISVPAQKTKSIPHQAPPLPSHYVDRPALIAGIVLQALGSESYPAGVLPITAILGIGGAGKSTIASAFANAAMTGERYPDGVFWVTLGPEPQIGSLLTSWVVATEGQLTETLPESASSNYLRTAFRERAALFVIDDVWNSDHVSPFLVGGNRCHVLITARRANIVDRLGATVVEVTEMTSAESYSLLVKRIGPARVAKMSASDHAEARLLTQQIGYLPLAIELVASLVARHYSWSETRRQLVGMVAALPAESGKESQARRKIDSCLGLSLDVLHREDPEAWNSFVWIALLPYEQPINASMACTLWDISEHEAGQRLQALADDAILRRHAGTYSVHNLLHQMARKFFSLAVPQGLGMSLQQGHRLLIDRYKKKLSGGQWDKICDDGYIVSRLVWHLYHASDYDEIFELLRAEDSNGLNSWYQRKFNANQIAEYLEDVDLLRRSASASKNVPHQLFAILCHSSVNSLSTNYTDEIFSALVRRGIWSATLAFEWIIDFCEQSQHVEFLIALSIAIRSTRQGSGFRDEEAENIAREALDRAQKELLKRAPTKAAVGLMKRYVAAASLLDVNVLKSIYAWCGSVEAQKLIFALSPEIRKVLVEQLADSMTPRDLVEKLVFLSTLISQGLVEKRMERCEQVLNILEGSILELLMYGKPMGDAPIEDAQLALPVPGDTQRAKISDQPQISPLHLPSYRSFDSVELYQFERYNQCLSVIESLFIYLPYHLLSRANSLIHSVADYEGIHELMQKLSLSREAPALENDTDPYAFIDRSIEEGKIETAVDAALSEVSKGNTQPIFKVLSHITANDVDLTIVKLGLLASELTAEMLRDIATQLALINPKAVAPAIILYGGVLTGIDIVDKIERSDSYDARIIALVCLLYGTREVAIEALNAISKIRDRREEVEVALAFMPFVPRDQRSTLYNDLRDEAIAGKQIAGMTEIMLLLSSAIEAGRLSDVVESTSKLHSEWWVVEAMSVTILRVSSTEEIKSVLACMPQIKNLDLRARILERIALRMADLGQNAMAIEACTSIELKFAQWDALGELSKRFAAIGELESGLDAASKITSIEHASKAFLDIALEVGAHGRPAEARAIVTEHVVTQKWRLMADSLFNADNRYFDFPKRTVGMRNTGEAGFTRFELVLHGIAQAEAILGKQAKLDEIACAAEAADRVAMERAIRTVWEDTVASQDSLSAAFHSMRRPVLLKVLSALAPIFERDGDSSDAAPFVESVRCVCRWWP